MQNAIVSLVNLVPIIKPWYQLEPAKEIDTWQKKKK